MKAPLLLRNPRAGAGTRRESWSIETLLLEGELDCSACADRELLVIEGGDGTVQRVLTRLLRSLPADVVPPIAILPAGTTNMSCADFNEVRRYRGCAVSLRSILAGSPPAIISKPVVRVAAGTDVHYGFCFCLGVIVDAVQQFAKARSGRQIMDGLAMASVVGRCLLRTQTSVVVQTPSGRIETFAMVATTLDRLLYGMRPWVAGNSPSGLHTTWIEAGAPGLWRLLPAFARGDPSLFLRPGFRSQDIHSMELGFEGPFVMDGEVLANPENGVRVTPGPALRFVVL